MSEPKTRDMTPLERLFEEVKAEIVFARAEFPPFNSPHEGWAVILEEVDELWDEVKANRGYTPEARKEALQVAAMGLRYILDVSIGGQR